MFIKPDDPALPCSDDPELWFVDDGTLGHARVEADRLNKLIQEAKDGCAVCDIRAACLDYALNHNEHGIWGGLTRAERRKLHRRSAHVA
ncbi:WhiB family transcriptional regulator [Spirillospora sp. CA-128828]|uniref:WhiB family transcriptional regulator n=1 Tax=Spirillospora sp. CA-128828 TaxID=3240033 RepID=UPI003D8FB957